MKKTSYTFNPSDPDSTAKAIGDASERMLLELSPLDAGALAYGMMYTYNTLKTAKAMGDTSIKCANAIYLLEMIFDFAKVEIPRHVTLTPKNENESH